MQITRGKKCFQNEGQSKFNLRLLINYKYEKSYQKYEYEIVVFQSLFQIQVKPTEFNLWSQLFQSKHVDLMEHELNIEEQASTSYGESF